MEIDCTITFLVGQERTVIRLHDNDASVDFATVILTNDQLASALSGRAYTPCESTEVYLDNVGKVMEHKKFEFKIPSDIKRSELPRLANLLLTEGWTTTDSFSSQDTFFWKGNDRYARCTVRRWVKKESHE